MSIYFSQLHKDIERMGKTLSGEERKTLKAALDRLDNRHQFSVTSYPVPVNYCQTLKKMIKNNEFDWKSNLINNDNFPSSERGKVEVTIKLVGFDYKITSESVIKELDRLGLRPATLKELLAFGVAQRDIQRSNYAIVALGSVWSGYDGCVRVVPYISAIPVARSLNHYWWDGVWGSDWQFAALGL